MPEPSKSVLRQPRTVRETTSEKSGENSGSLPRVLRAIRSAKQKISRDEILCLADQLQLENDTTPKD